MKRKVLALGLAITMFCAMGITAFADGNATVSFTDDKKLEYSNVGTAEGGGVSLGSFNNVAPGETITQTITVRNDNERTADFYISAEAVKALESGAAKGAGYDITLKAGDTTLYDSTLGGYSGTSAADASTTGITGMNATLGKDENGDGIADYILFATLPKGKSTNVVLTIKLDGEAMDNTAGGVDYSSTMGQIAFDFQVGYEDPTGQTVIVREVGEDGQVTYVRKVVEIFENAVPLGAVATGDGAMIGLAAVVLLIGASLIIMGRKKKVEE